MNFFDFKILYYKYFIILFISWGLPNSHFLNCYRVRLPTRAPSGQLIFFLHLSFFIPFAGKNLINKKTKFFSRNNNFLLEGERVKFVDRSGTSYGILSKKSYIFISFMVT